MKHFYLVLSLMLFGVSIQAQNWSGSTQGSIYYNQGNVGIGTSSPSQKLHVTGNIQVSYSRFIGQNLTDTFDYLDKIQPHYGMQWTNDPQFIGASTLWISSYGGMKFFSAGQVRMKILANGNVGIGTTVPTNKLEVNGTIRAKEVKLEAHNWPDYVFEKDYELMPLEAVNSFIGEHGHLPGLKSANVYEEEGVNMLELNQKLLEKVEELTLYTIDQEKKIRVQNKEINDLKSEIQEIRQLIKEKL
ncbi:hypothetical protein ACFSKL_22300 [Belliella marina]|uniref:Uncharacterized protein n=1 Tax=Belliella marina TaxID=1644146 RepID=A0ABW4VW50_9BACT